MEGNDKTIRNLYIRGVVETPDRLDALGLFGLLDGATIRNLKIAEVDIVATYTGGVFEDGDENSAGALAAFIVGNSQIVAVTVADSDSGVINLQGADTDDGQYVGGLVGRLFTTDGVIRGSSAAVTVSGGTGSFDSVGGLVGNLDGGDIIASHASGAVSGQEGGNDSVGGLVGHQEGSSSIIASYASGAISDQEGDYDSVGGLVGRQEGSSIIASYASGNVIDQGGIGDRVGGLVGTQGGSSSIIAASHASGAATNQGSAFDNVGGLVGQQDGGSIVASYAIGAVQSAMSSHNFAGRLLGRGFSNLINSYGFGAVTGTNNISSLGAPPDSITMAEKLTGTSGTSGYAGSAWKSAVWNFGNAMQTPALKYVDGYDADGPDDTDDTDDDHAFSCDPASFLPLEVICGTTPLQGQGR